MAARAAIIAPDAAAIAPTAYEGWRGGAGPYGGTAVEGEQAPPMVDGRKMEHNPDTQEAVAP